MKNQHILDTFLQELEDYEIFYNNKATGVIEIEKAKQLLNLCAIALDNECECNSSEEIEDILDRGKTYERLGAYA